MRPRVTTALAALAALTVASGCSPGADAHSASSPTNVVDGITIPPPYVAPAGTVVPGPHSCPASFRATLDAGGGRWTSTTQRAAHLLTCTYQDAHAVQGGCSGATVTVNTEPQAFTAFDRWNVETGQNSMWGHDPKLQPVPVSGVGIEAEWVPKLRELGTANDTTWVSVVLTCSAEKPSVIALAKALAKDGLASTA